MKSKSNTTTEDALATISALSATLIRNPTLNVYTAFANVGRPVSDDFDFPRVYDALSKRGCQFCAKCQNWFIGKDECYRCHTKAGHPGHKRKSVADIVLAGVLPGV